MMLLSSFTRTMAQSEESKIYVQVSLAEIRKANATKARLDSAHVQGKIVLSDFKKTQDSLKTSTDSVTYWKGLAFHWEGQAGKFKKQRNRWMGAAFFEAVLIGLGLKHKS